MSCSGFPTSIVPIRRLLICLLLALLAAPATAHASRTMEIGIQDDAVFLNQAGYGQPSARAGQAFGTGGPRAFQFAARLEF